MSNHEPFFSDDDFEEIQSFIDNEHANIETDGHINLSFVMNNASVVLSLDLVPGQEVEFSDKDREYVYNSLGEQGAFEHDPREHNEIRRDIFERMDQMLAEVNKKMSGNGLHQRINMATKRYMADLREIEKDMQEDTPDNTLAAITYVIRSTELNPLEEMFKNMLRSGDQNVTHIVSDRAQFGHVLNGEYATAAMRAFMLLTEAPDALSEVILIMATMINPDVATEAVKDHDRLTRLVHGLRADLYGEDTLNQMRMILLQIAVRFIRMLDPEDEATPDEIMQIVKALFNIEGDEDE